MAADVVCSLLAVWCDGDDDGGDDGIGCGVVAMVVVDGADGVVCFFRLDSAMEGMTAATVVMTASSMWRTC